MNSKELLEQAEDKAYKIKETSDKLRTIEKVIDAAQSGAICILYGGCYTRLTEVLDTKRLEDVSTTVKADLAELKNEKVTELEQLLGIQQKQDPGTGAIVIPEPIAKKKPAIINPELEQAFQGKKDPANTEAADPVEEKLAGILQEEAKRIEDKPKLRRKIEYPESMTVENVQKMYHVEGKTINEIAKYYGINYSAASNFISRNHLFRSSNPLPNKEPGEKERP